MKNLSHETQMLIRLLLLLQNGLHQDLLTHDEFASSCDSEDNEPDTQPEPDQERVSQPDPDSQSTSVPALTLTWPSVNFEIVSRICSCLALSDSDCDILMREISGLDLAQRFPRSIRELRAAEAAAFADHAFDVTVVPIPPPRTPDGISMVEEESVCLIHRNVLVTIQQLVNIPEHAKWMVWRHDALSDPDDPLEESRTYSELNTGDWWAAARDTTWHRVVIARMHYQLRRHTHNYDWPKGLPRLRHVWELAIVVSTQVVRPRPPRILPHYSSSQVQEELDTRALISSICQALVHGDASQATLGQSKWHPPAIHGARREHQMAMGLSQISVFDWR
jgi:hypothetical protein